MKTFKFNFLFVVLLSMVTVLASCSKDEGVTPKKETEPETSFQLADVVGDWTFSSLKVNGDTFNSCIFDLISEYDLSVFDLVVTNSTLSMTTNCIDYHQNEVTIDFSFTLKNDVLEFSNTSEEYSGKFQILDATATTLKLKLLEFNSNDHWSDDNAIEDATTNGEYVFTK